MSAPDRDGLDADVLIVGAGPVGGALAVDLQQNGTRTLVLEARQAGEPPHPGTNLANARTMEHMRRWGATPHLRAANPVGPEIVRDACYVTRSNGYMLCHLPKMGEFAEPKPFSSAGPQYGPQRSIEEGLRSRLSELGGGDRIRFGCTVEGYREDGDSVEVTFSSQGETQTLRCRYLVGADGSRSVIRRQLGIKMEGNPEISRASGWYVRAPEAMAVFERNFGFRAAFVWIVNEEDGGAAILPQNSDGLIQYFDVIGEDEDGDDWDRAYERLCKSVGATIEATPMDGGQISMRSVVAPRFSAGRVFLAGESCHLISTAGGFGMNTGIGDAADLGWKLTAAVDGWAGQGLLDSYSIDRVPVVRRIRDLAEWSVMRRGSALALPGLERPGPEGEEIRRQTGERINRAKRQELASYGAQFGVAYRASPICVCDGTEPPAASFGDYTPSASPGARLPHLWLGEDHSLYDEVSTRGLTLVRCRPGADVSGLERAAAEKGVPLSVREVGDDGYAATCEASLVLVRPDHYVAWRGDSAPKDAGAVIDKVRGA